MEENKQENWKNYISKLSSATKTKSVYDMIKKIAGRIPYPCNKSPFKKQQQNNQ